MIVYLCVCVCVYVCVYVCVCAKVAMQCTDVDQTHAECQIPLSSKFCSPSHVEGSITI